MMSNRFLRVNDVAEELGVSVSYAYKIIRKLNAELENKGIITIAGRVNKQYFTERLCYMVTSFMDKWAGFSLPPWGRWHSEAVTDEVFFRADGHARR